MCDKKQFKELDPQCNKKLLVTLRVVKSLFKRVFIAQAYLVQLLREAISLISHNECRYCQNRETILKTPSFYYLLQQFISV